MVRKKPTNRSDAVGKLSLHFSEAVAEYLVSRHQRDFYVKPPNWDSYGDSIEQCFIDNTREKTSMLKLQREMKDNDKNAIRLNYQRTREIFKMQKQLRREFIAVNNFLKDCADKKLTAEKQTELEIEQHHEYRAANAKLSRDLNKLKSFYVDLKETFNDYEPYERILMEVIQKSPVYSSLKDCTQRSDALMLAQVDISKLKEIKCQELETMRNCMIKITNEAALTILGLKNDLAALVRGYNVAMSECKKWESMLSNVSNHLIRNELENRRTLLAVKDLFRLLAARNPNDAKSVPRIYEAEMDFIKNEVEIFCEVINIIKIDKSDSLSKHEGTC